MHGKSVKKKSGIGVCHFEGCHVDISKISYIFILALTVVDWLFLNFCLIISKVFCGFIANMV